MRFNSFQFTSQQNEKIQVLDFGMYNAFNAGPDFKHGAITIDGIEMHGQIEMHVKSSDWLKHKHHKDRQYNNVILHVVYENDIEIVQNGVKIPTIEIKNQIDHAHFAQYTKKQFNRLDFPCEHGLSEVDEFHMNAMKIDAITKKLDNKIDLLLELGLESEQEILYNLFGLSFSMSVNKNAFLHLMNNVPYSSMRNIANKKKAQLIMSESGLLQKDSNHVQEFWHFKGTRPSSFPTIRVNQFALLVASLSFEFSFLHSDAKSIVYSFKQMVSEIDFSASNGKKNLTNKMIDLLIINALVPFVWYLGGVKEDEIFKEKAMDILELLPPESNSITNRWKKINIKPKNAFDSQSLLALYRYFCNQKKCLSCNVGQKVLNIE